MPSNGGTKIESQVQKCDQSEAMNVEPDTKVPLYRFAEDDGKFLIANSPLLPAGEERSVQLGRVASAPI